MSVGGIEWKMEYAPLLRVCSEWQRERKTLFLPTPFFPLLFSFPVVAITFLDVIPAIVSQQALRD